MVKKSLNSRENEVTATRKASQCDTNNQSFSLLQ